jgi:hypothetical protein
MQTLEREAVRRDRAGGDDTGKIGLQKSPRTPARGQLAHWEATGTRQAEVPLISPALHGSQSTRLTPQAAPTFWLEKSLVVSGLVVSAVLIVFFSLDLALRWPLERASVLFDECSVACGLILLYLAWDVLRSQMARRLWTPL